MLPRGRRGFTLIELIIVILVIGILSAIAVPKLRLARDRAYKNAMVADLRTLANLQEVYHTEYYTYALGVEDLGYVPGRGVTITVNLAESQGWGAVATHDGVPDGTCGVFLGDAAGSGGPATVAGVVDCDFDP